MPRPLPCDELSRLPPDVALILTDLDRERERRMKSMYKDQGGMLKLTDRQYFILREHIINGIV